MRSKGRLRQGVVQRGAWLATCGWLAAAAGNGSTQEYPAITELTLADGRLVIETDLPPGYGSTVLEGEAALGAKDRELLIGGLLDGHGGRAVFRLPVSDKMMFLRVRIDPNPSLPSVRFGGSDYFEIEYRPTILTEAQRIGHVLNRVTYGPNAGAVARVEAMGIRSYLEEQLTPGVGPESARLQAAENALFQEFRPRRDHPLIAEGAPWRFHKGTTEPPSEWRNADFDDRDWPEGPSGFGYGNDAEHQTVLDDMRQLAPAGDDPGQPGYLSLYLRHAFVIEDPAAVGQLLLAVNYDDAFVAYLNGVEVARDNIAGRPPRRQTSASGNHEADGPVEFNLERHRSLLQSGGNVLAIQGHNVSLTSSDFSLIPQLLDRRFLDEPAERRIDGVSALKQLVHLRGVWSERQLQTVLAEFWENHFTTDYDKTVEYLEDLENSDGSAAMSRDQARSEAAQLEYAEYQFFYDHALGNFGDLLLYSATSPAQLIYLDNVLNLKDKPNENYAREILELFAFGVDNRYAQRDIEELARCFTGWTARKVWPSQRPSFPASALQPPTGPSVQFEDTVLLDTGPGWRYFKGVREPAPNSRGRPTLEWAKPGFEESGWLSGSTSIGYGDNDDATVLADMRNRYTSVYLRHELLIDDPAAYENLVLSVDYDDGYIAYLNGVEIARSDNMGVIGFVPPFNATADSNHEVTRPAAITSLRPFLSLFRPAPEPNILAIQVHNVARDSSDLSIHPRLIDRRLVPGSIENGDPNGRWTFRFNPEEHDFGPKTLFAGTPHEMRIPGDRQGIEGLRDAVDVIQQMVEHPSTREFICIKLINKFVSDGLTLENCRDGTAPPGLLELLERARTAWQSTTPRGNIRTVLESILDPAQSRPNDGFWASEHFRAKVKTPIEFINSTLRALDTDFDASRLPALLANLGMELFTRDDPDGWSEYGIDWVDTATLLERIRLAQLLANNLDTELEWDLERVLAAERIESASDVIDHYDDLLFQRTLTPLQKRLLLEFAETHASGRPLPLTPDRADYLPRVRELMGLLLAMPQWMYQ